MTIQHFENFHNDDQESILSRYAGSTNTSSSLLPNTWPLKQGAATNEDGEASLALPLTVYGSSLEVAFSLTNDGDETNLTDNASLFILGGIELTPNADSGVSVRINGNTTYQLTGGNHRTAANVVQNWNIRYDKADKLLYVIINGKPVLRTNIEEDPTWEPKIRFTAAPNSQASTFNNTLTGLVVAYDTAPETFIQNIQYQNVELTLVDSGGWPYSGTSIIDDLNKDSGKTANPYVEVGDGDLQLSLDVAPDSYVQVYLAGQTSDADGVQLEVVEANTSLTLTNTQNSLPIVSMKGPNTLTLRKAAA